jgi:hypothetical protein
LQLTVVVVPFLRGERFRMQLLVAIWVFDGNGLTNIALWIRRRCRSEEEELDDARISAFFSRFLDDVAEPAAGIFLSC